MPTIENVLEVASRDESFLEKMSDAHDERILNSIGKLRENITSQMRRLDSSGGRLVGAKVNLKQAQTIHKKLVREFEETYNVDVQDFLGDFSQIENRIERSFRELGESVKFAGVSKDMIKTLRQQTYRQYVQFGEKARDDIASAMYNHVLGREKYSSLLNTISGILTGHKDIRGRPMTSYTKLFARDSVRNYFNQLHTSKGEEIGMKHFLYVGNAIADTRYFCITRIGKVYTKNQIQSWDFDWTGKSGPAFEHCGGYNCRHHWRPVRPEWLKDKYGDETLPKERAAKMLPKKNEELMFYEGKVGEFQKVKQNLEMEIVEWKETAKQGASFAAEAKEVIPTLKDELASAESQIKYYKQRMAEYWEKQSGTYTKNFNYGVAKYKDKGPLLINRTSANNGQLTDRFINSGVDSVSFPGAWGRRDVTAIGDEVADQLEDLRERFPMLKKEMKLFQLQEMKINAAKTLRGEGLPSSAAGYYDPDKFVIEVATSGVPRGHALRLGDYVISDDLGSTVRHEWGHFLSDSGHHGRTILTRIRKFEDLFNKRGADYFDKVSRYATTAVEEAWAECFSAYTSPLYGKKKGYFLPKDIHDLFEEWLGKPKTDKRLALQRAKKLTAAKPIVKKKIPVKKKVKKKSKPLAKMSSAKDKNLQYTRRDGRWYKGNEEVIGNELEKLKSMGLPPGWSEVKATLDDVKIQAIGKDAAGRWQYRYSAKHIEAAARKKFDRVRVFTKDMKDIKSNLKNDIAARDPRALVLDLESKTAIRAGSTTDFKAKKKAYGLTTLQHEHVKISGDKITLDFVAKEGIPAHYELTDPVLADFLAERKASTTVGERLFPDVPAKTLNNYLKELAGGKSYTVKDFRTYWGTKIAHVELQKYAGAKLTAKAKKNIIKKVSTKVSEFLHNTPGMAKKSYIDPMVWEVIGGL